MSLAIGNIFIEMSASVLMLQTWHVFAYYSVLFFETCRLLMTVFFSYCCMQVYNVYIVLLTNNKPIPKKTPPSP